MYHSIIFGPSVQSIVGVMHNGETNSMVKHTWDDWHLIPSSRPTLPPPPVKTKDVEIPGADGKLDLTEILAGAPLYGNRSGSIEFYVAQDWYNQSTGQWDTWDWITAYQTIMAYIHGQRMYMIMEDDPGYYYSGRFSVNSWKSNKDFSQISINYDLDPFKWSIHSSAEDWLWDPFDFETGYINDLQNISATIPDSGAAWPSIDIVGGTRRGMIRVQYTPNENSTEKLYFHRLGDASTATYPEGGLSGTNGNFVQILGLFIQPGVNTIEYYGDGTFTIDYRGSEF